MKFDIDAINSAIDRDKIAARAIEKLSRLYSNKAHFVYELIQNSDDARSATLDFVLQEEGLLLWNCGKLFTAKNVIAICSVGESSKDLTQIGTHGIGFKAVYAWTDTPMIYSGNLWFVIHNYIRPKELEQPSKEIVDLANSGATVFHLPFKPKVTTEDKEKLSGEIGHIHEWTLLFLRFLRSIQWTDERTGSKGTLVRKSSRSRKVSKAEVVELHADAIVNGRFLLFRTLKKPPAYVINHLLNEATHEDECERIRRSADTKQPIEIGFALNGDTVVPQERAVLFSFLPTEIATGLLFLLQARYQTTPARDNILDVEESAWNRWLVEETASFLPTILESLKQAGWLRPSFYNVLPNSATVKALSDRVQQIVAPLHVVLLTTFQTRDLVPTLEGRFTSAGYVYRPHASGLIDLVDVKAVTGNAEAAWLDSRVEWNREGGCILQEAGVQTVTAEMVVEWLQAKDAHWFQSQDTPWIILLYSYLAEHKKIWRALTKVPFIRLQDGQHIAPSNSTVFFSPDDEAQAIIKDYGDRLPLLHPDIDTGETQQPIHQFLSEQGVRTLRPASFVRSWLLPIYDADKYTFDRKEHCSHFHLLRLLLGKVSQVDRKQLIQEVKQRFRILTYANTDHGDMKYVRPNAAYLPMDYTNDSDLEEYFASSNGIRFVSAIFLEGQEDTPQIVAFLVEIGAHVLPYRKKITDPFLSEEKKRALRNGDGAKNEALEDWSLDGLDAALIAIRENHGSSPRLAHALWRLLVKLKKEKEGSFWQATYKYTYYTTTYTRYYDAKFVELLRIRPWLPDESGLPRTPNALIAPSAPTRQVLGDSVAYLHPDFDVRDNSDTRVARQMANTVLGVRLTPTVAGAVAYLKKLSKTHVQLATVEPIYDFLRRNLELAHQFRPDFANHPLVYVTSPEPRWWKKNETFWADESRLFGTRRGYLESIYPSQRTFFTSTLEIPIQATTRDVLDGLRIVSAEIATSDGTVHPEQRKCLRQMYLFLLREIVQHGPFEGDVAGAWEEMRQASCWLGIKGQSYACYRVDEIIYDDHPHVAALFREALPFWALEDSASLALDHLGVIRCSSARPLFLPEGKKLPMPDITDCLRGIVPYVGWFFGSPLLAREHIGTFDLELLRTTEVIWTERGTTQFDLLGKVVTDPDGRLGHFDADSATIWITDAATPEEYPFVVADAIEQQYGVPRLREYIQDLFRALDQGVSLEPVLRRWRRDGLVFPEERTVCEEDDEWNDQKQSSSNSDVQENRPDATEETVSSPEVNETGQEAGVATEPGPTKNTDQDTSQYPLQNPSVPPLPPPLVLASLPPSGHRNVTGGMAGQSGTGGSGLGGHSGTGVSGESPYHLALKMKVAKHPEYLDNDLTLIQSEFVFDSGDRADVLLQTSAGIPVAVEVETRIEPGNLVGMWQAIKYKHLAAVRYRCHCDAVRAYLVAPSIPSDVKSACVQHSILPVELDIE